MVSAGLAGIRIRQA